MELLMLVMKLGGLLDTGKEIMLEGLWGNNLIYHFLNDYILCILTKCIKFLPNINGFINNAFSDITIGE